MNAMHMKELTLQFSQLCSPIKKVTISIIQTCSWNLHPVDLYRAKCFFTLDIVAYEPSICRSLAITYRKKAKYNGIPVSLYEADFGEAVNIKPCFCRAEGECPPKGTIDLFKCAGTPMFMSLPHFYLADEKLLAGIGSGLTPDKEKHGIYLMFEGVGEH